MRPLLTALLLCCSTMAQAAIQTREVPYTAADGTRLVGYHAWDDAISGPRPGVIVVHEWWGLNDYAKRRARDLAALGYSALAVDMYGDGRNTQHPDDAKAFMNAALADPAIPKARFQAGLDLLKAQPQTDPARLAAIGYCFGGKVVLDMARQGLPLAAVVSFHGALVTATPATPGSVKAKVLVEHGAADSFVTPEQIAAFKAEMDQAGADYRFVELPGAKHGFSNPDADAHKGHGLDLGYQKEADERSWADMQALFKDVF
ncbi:dienelactone hydrolase family protein [Aquipseudomonas alcaligenes]|uniref:Hydrolase n=1 Tax=Aquipseudomonas alcaligenes (strain ATCC 14909 / DSM 50342 / CCUG 1425 / JCM 20561 / NBRC 14159 / NCIMB 9945 / NCTC 10367 / 1577) TaxID=1215092 RepID=U2ZUE2_AQUA1|nr:dienelactone hydrolase family protein [Pseudomonas alcaligenes]GAD64697.1 putative hydrolase [Pseudomonas alcaligenes NBRC 14159]SUD17714.1 hydrolase [Pseudomonas alcaligenes]